ncbi:class I adenylate-forming enzyme family protein [Kineobactrum sediminis]|nr:AMP-binding protein [Kineobactrum sediminis]
MAVTPVNATTLGDFLLRSAQHWPDNTALVFADTRLSYGELYQAAFDKARLLQGLDVGVNDHVGILMSNCPEAVEWLFATALSGAVAVMINARYKAHELAYVLGNADITTLIAGTGDNQPADYIGLLCEIYPQLQAGGAAPSLPEAPLLTAIITTGTETPPDNGLFVAETELMASGTRVSISAANARRASLPLDQSCLMMYTSGTTANPKGCPLSHEMVTRKAFTIADRLLFQEEDRQWNPLPLFHLASIMPMLASFSVGSCYLTDTHFEAGAAWEQILGERASVLYPAFPTIMSDLVTHPLFAQLDPAQIRLINNVAPPERLLANMKLLPKTLHVSAYGLTEGTGLSCYSNPEDDDATRAQVIGTPLPGTLVRIVDPSTGCELPAAAAGELQISGYSVFRGYYKAPKATREAFTADGWFRTGDICSLDEHGRISYRGRLKDTFKVGGENVSALEIESFLSTHPAVKFVQAVGVPDPRLEEVVAVFVELNPGAACNDQQIMDFCKGRISSFKVPRYVEFVTEWPMSATKVQKFSLRDKLITRLNL